jgi:hypothetical protein
MEAPKTIKDVQKLTGCMAALNRFISRLGERGCHTLKYLILGCEYLSEYVHLSIGFSENFKDFSRNYSHLS